MNHFTIIAKPYLLSDLWQAAANVADLFRDILEYDETSSSVLQTLQSLDGNEVVTPGLQHDVRGLVESLGGSHPSSDEQQTLDQLVRVVDGLLEWPEQTGGTLLWNQSRHLEATDSDPAYKVKIKHPKPESYSVEIRRDPSMRGSCWIASESYWQSFRVNPPENNILYLTAEYKSYDFVEFIYENQHRAYYMQLDYADKRLAFPKSLVPSQNEELGAFFQEVSAQAFGAKGNAPTVTLYLSAMSDRAVYRDYPSIGWLNPLILTFDMEDDDIPVEATESRADQALKIFSNPDLLLHFEPHFDALDSARLELFKTLLRQQSEQRDVRSAVEYLFWGEPNSKAWQTFFILDKLNGSFLIDDFGDYGFEAEMPSCYWLPPEGLSRNEYWLKTYLLGLSDHIQEAPQSIDLTLSPSNMPGFGSPRGHKRFHLDAGKTPISIFEVLSAITETANSALAAEGQVTTKLLDSLLTFALGFLGDLKQMYGNNSETLYFGEGSFQVHGDGTVSFNDLGFLETFAKTYLSPRSDIFVRLSPIEITDACVNLIESLPYGDKKLFESLWFAQLDGFVDEDYVDIIYDYAWWQDWFEVLFMRPWNVKINYISNRGFIVRRSLLGQGRLGKAHIGKQYSVTEMRI